ncbi:MAG TPA: hypothetical protein VMW03_08215 [Candidatus Krumholzibacteriaceae bacterium]|nr:hypothetical protein [Candidatus Krumholzibacteriaceae bacterium]
MRVCRIPPDSVKPPNDRKVVQIFRRLLRSFSDSYFWSIVTIIVITIALFSATVFPALGSAMRRVSLEFEGKSTPVVEVKAVYPDYWDTSYPYTFLNNQSIEGAFDPWAGFWKLCLSETDVTRIEQLEGVESVVRVIDLDSRVRPEVLTKCVTDDLKERIESMMSTYPEFFERKGMINRASSWNMTLVEYMNLTGSYYGMVTRCIESDKIAGWRLQFGEESLTSIPVEKRGSSIIVKEYLLSDECYEGGHRIGKSAYFLIGQTGAYCPGSPVWLVEMEINGTAVFYDLRHNYSFNVTSSVPSTSFAWNGRDPGIIADLDTFIKILEEERNPDGAPFPLYTSLIVKPALPTDYNRVEGMIRSLFPGKAVSRAGAAPVSIGEKAKQADTEFHVMSVVYTSMSAGLGAVILLVEAVRNRKLVWLLKIRGWSGLDMLSYGLARAGMMGLIAGGLTMIITWVSLPLVIDTYAPSSLMVVSSTVSSLILKALNESVNSNMILSLPILGVTVTVLCSAPSIIYNLLTRPRENLYDSPVTNVNEP